MFLGILTLGLFRTQRWAVFLTLGILAWLIVTFYQPRAIAIRRRVAPVTAFPARVMERRRNRLILIAVVVVLTLFIPA